MFAELSWNVKWMGWSLSVITATCAINRAYVRWTAFTVVRWDWRGVENTRANCWSLFALHAHALPLSCRIVHCARSTVYAHIFWRETNLIPWWGNFSLPEQIPSYCPLTWRTSSRDDSTRALQCFHYVICPGRSGTCRRSSLLPFIPGWGLLHEFISDNALVSEKVGKIVNFEKHDVRPSRPWQETCTMSKIWSRFSQNFPCSSQRENS